MRRSFVTTVRYSKTIVYHASISAACHGNKGTLQRCTCLSRSTPTCFDFSARVAIYSQEVRGRYTVACGTQISGGGGWMDLLILTGHLLNAFPRHSRSHLSFRFCTRLNGTLLYRCACSTRERMLSPSRCR